MILDHSAVRRVRSALEAGGVTTDIVILDEHARTAEAAATQLDVQVAQIANSLIFTVPVSGGLDSPAAAEGLLVLTSGAHRVDTGKVAELLGVDRVDQADADFVRDRTGFAIGGVAPVGHPAPLRTLIDVRLAEHEEVWAAAGHPRSVFRTSFDQLLRLTGGTPAEVAS